MATSSGRLARKVYMKNLIAAYFLRGPPQTAMRKYIGIRPTSQKTKNWNRPSDGVRSGDVCEHRPDRGHEDDVCQDREIDQHLESSQPRERTARVRVDHPEKQKG